MSRLEVCLKNCCKEVEDLIQKHLQTDDMDTSRVWEAMRYAALAGGKRIRPFLTCQVAEALEGDHQIALYFGAALEMIHSYSLIHDDLPCMDNDDYRRGRPTCHKRFDEATAVLAGDALLTHAFDMVLGAPATDKQKLEAISALTRAAGCLGMIGGQVMDLSSQNRVIDAGSLIKLQELKTGALLVCAGRLGCIAADCYEGAYFDATEVYTSSVGLVFQIVDDILDSYGTVAIGKPMHSDEENGKATFLTVFGLEAAKEYAIQTTQKAKDAIAILPHHDLLTDLASYLLERKQ